MKWKIKIISTPIAYDYFAKSATSEETYDTLSTLLDAFYHDKAEKDRAKQQGGELIRKNRE